MKSLLKVALLSSLLAVAMLAMAGCSLTAKNPYYNPALPPTASTGNNPEYVPSISGVSNVVAKGEAINNLVPTPYQGLINNAGNLVLGLTTIIAGLVAAQQNKKATAASTTANNATAAARVLANNVPSTSVQAAIESSPTPEIAGMVAAHLQVAS